MLMPIHRDFRVLPKVTNIPCPLATLSKTWAGSSDRAPCGRHTPCAARIDLSPLGHSAIPAAAGVKFMMSLSTKNSPAAVDESVRYR